MIGGYGGFGARLSRRLAGRGHTVLVAGRNLARAEAFFAELDGAEPVTVDRNGELGPLLACHSPDLVIDAAGPFQGSDYRVPLACMEAGISYVDLADARSFVIGIAALDAQAKAAGVAVVAGASSVPALSGAVARELAGGLDKIHCVEIAISASKRASIGASVVAAILSYVGKPIRLWRGRRWDRGHGWQELRRTTFGLSDGTTLRGRWLGLADVPDLELLPESLPGRPAVIFRAGTESALQMLGLWALSGMVRAFAMPVKHLARPLLLLQRLTRFLNSDRSAMSVWLKGESKGALLERHWTLIASDGHGPEIPTLAAVIVAEAILGGHVAPGARAAHASLTLAQFEPLFQALSVRHEICERPLPQPLYRRVMGERYEALPEAVRCIHAVCGDSGASGEAKVVCGRNPVARLIAQVMRFPREGRHAVHVAFSEDNGVECWTRSFGGRSFSSHLSERNGRLIERFGPLRFAFDLPSDHNGLEMRMRGWSLLGVPLPLILAPRSHAREWQEGARFRFDVPISLPLVGLVVHYSGWLDPQPNHQERPSSSE